MSSTFRLIMSSISGIIIGSLSYGLVFSLIILILNKVDKSGSWIGVIQNPVLIAFVFGICFGGIFGFFTGMVIGSFKITELLKGAFVGFVVAECMIIIALCAFSLIDSNQFSNLNSLLDSFVSIFFLFLILTVCFLLPSLFIGATTAKLNNFVQNLQNK